MTPAETIENHPPSPVAIAETAPCSKCSGELDTTGYSRWCKACRAKHRREYEGVRKLLNESRGWSAGVFAMRAYLAEAFEKYPEFQRFSGREIARVIRNVSGPSLPVD